jgi:hypothetical protein
MRIKIAETIVTVAYIVNNVNSFSLQIILDLKFVHQIICVLHSK